MAWSCGSPGYDSGLYDDANSVAAALKQVIEDNYRVELPALPVRSMVDEMVEAGMLERFPGEDGKPHVRLSRQGEGVAHSIAQLLKAPNN